MTRKAVALFSPLPPLRNGIAGYTEAFLPALGDAFDIYAVIDDSAPVPAIARPTLTMTEYRHYDASFAGAGHLYQLGNNPDHVYMLPAMAARPGLTTVHDLSLHHLFDLSLRRGADGRSYRDLMFECYGAKGEALVDDQRRGNGRSAAHYTELSFLPWVVRHSIGTVTHSRTGRLRLTALPPHKPVFVLPHPYHERASPYIGDRYGARLRARAQLGLVSEDVQILALGFVTRSKRLDLVLEALAAVRRSGRRAHLIVVGELRPEEYDLVADIERLDLASHVTLRGYVHSDDMFAYLAACDILVNLRYPSVGETSGALCNGIAIGCCSLVTDIGAFAELPDDVSLKIPIDEMNAEGVTWRLQSLIDKPDLRRFYERNAAAMGERVLDLDRVAEQYVAMIEKTLFPVAASAPGWSAPVASLPKIARRRIEDQAAALAQRMAPERAVGTMWWRELYLPLGGAGRLAVISDNALAARLARESFGWTEGLEALSIEAFLAGDDGERAEIALLDLEASDFMGRFDAWMDGCRRRLPMGALLIVNLRSDEMAEAAHPERLALEAGMARFGFQIRHYSNHFSEIVTAGAAVPAAAVESSVIAVRGSDACFAGGNLLDQHFVGFAPLPALDIAR